MELHPGIQIEDFTLVEQVGAGSSGTVYRATSPRYEGDLALKVIHRPFSNNLTERARLQREAEVQSRIDHPAIARLHRLHQNRDGLCLVMEFVPGRSLGELFDEGTMTRGQLLRIALQILDGLEAAWELDRIIHRDVKPSNIRVTPAGDAKLVDFGLARCFADRDETTLTGSGVILGTPAYMSPEQAIGKATDFRSDLYSLGVILYEGFTGKQPFRGSTPLEVILKHRELSPTAPSHLDPRIPPAISSAIMRFLEKRPDERFSSFEDARKLLLKCQELLETVADSTALIRLRDDRDSRENRPTCDLRPLSTQVRSPRPRALPRVAILALLPIGLLLGMCGMSPSSVVLPLHGASVACTASVECPLEMAGERAPPPADSPEYPCSYELRGFPCPGKSPPGGAVSASRDKVVDLGGAAPWRTFPTVLNEAIRQLGALDEKGRNQLSLGELEQESLARKRALEFVKQKGDFMGEPLQILQGLETICAHLVENFRKDWKSTNQEMVQLQTAVSKLPARERSILNEVMMHGSIPPLDGSAGSRPDRSEGSYEVAVPEPGAYRFQVVPIDSTERLLASAKP